MRMKNLAASFAVVAMALMSVGNARGDTITFQGGNLDVAGNWLASDGITTGFPVSGDTGIVNVDSTFPATAGAATLSAGGDLVFGGGSTLTAGIDVVASVPDSITFNDVTVNVNDDIFTGAGGNFIFNSGSVTNVDDDFEANAGGTITVNGGTHTLLSENTSNFGAQNNSTLNFLGGTVTGADLFRTTNAGASLTIGGSASINTLTIDFFAGTVGFESNWTGFIDNAAFGSLADYETLLIGDNATLDGALIDATVFNANFALNGSGALILTAVPEPGSVALLGLAGLGVMFRRRKQSQVA